LSDHKDHFPEAFLICAGVKTISNVVNDC